MNQRFLTRLFLTGFMILFGLTSALADSFPTVKVSLSRSIYYITANHLTGEPVMPAEVAAAAVCSVGDRHPNFTWHASLDWNFAAYPTHHSISRRSFWQPSPLKLDFGKEVRGGTLRVTAKLILNGTPVCGEAQAMVIALNPSRQQILRRLPLNRFGLIASKIGVWESGMRQFNPITSQVKSGLPYTSPTNDVGLMQLNPACGSLSSPEQVWDWRANLQRGLEILQSKFAASRSYSSELAQSSGMQISRSFLPSRHTRRNFRRTNQQTVVGLSERVGTGQLPGDCDVDHLSLSAWERDAIRRYNGGREYSCRMQYDPLTGR